MRSETKIKLYKAEKTNFSAKIKQSMKILKMSMYDLKVYINSEYIDNPALEIYERDNSSVENENDNNISPYLFLEKHKSLKEFLMEELKELRIDKKYIKSCRYIVKSLNGNGYLDMKLSDINRETGIPIDILEKSLKIIQSLEPYGIGARNLKECLLIQTKKLCISNDKIDQIIKNHLSDIGNGRLDLISKKLSIPEPEVKKYVKFIRELEPKPSRGFYTGEETSFIIPDAEIKALNGNICILMNDTVIPSITINRAYKKVLEKNNKNTKEKYYNKIKDEIDEAYNLINDIEERRKIVYSILEYIGNMQREYFMYGKDKIKKISLDNLCSEIGIDQFVVKSAIKNKSVLTKYGIIQIEKLIDI